MPETVSGPSAGFVANTLGTLTRGSDHRVVNLPLFPSGQQVFAPDKPDFTPRGQIDTDFQPRAGNVNPATEPPTPLPAPITQTPMPSRVGAVLMNESTVEAMGDVALAFAEGMRTGWEPVEAKRQTVQQDIAFANALLSALATRTSQLVLNRTDAGRLKERKDEKGKVRRWRLHGYSRKRDNSATPVPVPPSRPWTAATHYVVSTRRVADIIAQGTHALTVELIAHLGSRSGLGYCLAFQGYGRDAQGAVTRLGTSETGYPASNTPADDPSKWEFRWPDDPPACAVQGDAVPVPATTTERSGRARVMTLHAARELLAGQMDVWEDRVRNYYGKFPGRIYVNEPPPDENGMIEANLEAYAARYWRAANFIRLVAARRRIAEAKMAEAINAAAYATAKDKVRVGPQLVSTRRDLSRIRPFSWFRFSGYDAFRAGVGRPPLPEAEWLRRYRARLAKRNKTGRTRKSKGVKVPNTRWNWRPRQQLDLTHA